MEETIKKLADTLGLSENAVRNAYKAYWRFIRDKITNLKLKKNISKDDYEKLRTSFNLPSLGKLNCPYDRWERIRKSEELKIKNTIEYDDNYKED
jgi:hypothetical protein